jgi:hypothetical protein
MRRLHRLLLAAGWALVLALVCVSALALARPGGGDSWSGGGGGGGDSGGGGGGGDSGAIFQLVWVLLNLCIDYPAFGIPLTICVIAFFVFSKMRSPSDVEWNSAPPVPVQKVVTLDAVKRLDPDFSQVVFEDFCFRLYPQAQMARTSREAMVELSPYLRPEAQQALVSRSPGTHVPVSNVIVGALRVFRVDVPHTNGPATPNDYVRVGIELETNYTLGHAGQQKTFYAVEQWVLARQATARTKPPKTSNKFPCPNCGAPFETSDGTRCTYCNEVVNNGRFDWVVTSVTLLHERMQAPALTTEVPEQGTHLPTVKQPNVTNLWMTLLRDDPLMNEAAFFERARLIHREMTASWTKNDLRGARPYVSDGLFDYLRYWVEAYLRAGLRNVLENAVIEHAELAKVTRDRYYDAVTLRVFGTGLDYVVDGTGRKVKGDKSRPRKYSEYWTLVRGSHARGTPRTESACASCGAPLQSSMSGTCDYCHVHVTAGEFDWVLSKIEQDDTYRG